MKSERRWICLVFGFIGLWLLVLSSTLYTTITKSGLLIDTEVDLSYITLPLLGIILLYTLVTIFIFVTYFVGYNSVKRYQLKMYYAKNSIEKVEPTNKIKTCLSRLVRLFIFTGYIASYTLMNFGQRKMYSAKPSIKKVEAGQGKSDDSDHPLDIQDEAKRICYKIKTSISKLIRIFIFASFMTRYNITRLYQLRMSHIVRFYQHGMYSTKHSLNKVEAGQGISDDSDHLANIQDEEKRTCSIIIPSRNEESVIKRTIIECLKQTYSDIEIIVVCHNCTDSTFQEARHSDKRVKAFDLKTEESGKGIALNYGLKQASGEFVLILDGDGILTYDFIEKALPLFNENYAAVQGRYMPSNRDYNMLTKLLSIEGDLWSTPYMTARSFLEKRCGLGGTGYIVRRSVLMQEGMFANHLVDDYELTFRLLKKKNRIAFAPLSIDFDEKPPTLEIMLRQRARWAKGFISLLTKRIAEPTDIIGNIHWLSPIAAISGIIMLLIPAYASIHYMLYEYYPYTYSYMPLNLWFILTGLIYGLQAGVLYKQDGIKGLKRALYLPLYNAFSHYWFVSFCKAFFVKSWANTKTMHGFTTKVKEVQKIIPKIRSP